MCISEKLDKRSLKGDRQYLNSNEKKNEEYKMMKSEIKKFVFYRENNNKIFGLIIFVLNVCKTFIPITCWDLFRVKIYIVLVHQKQISGHDHCSKVTSMNQW